MHTSQRRLVDHVTLRVRNLEKSKEFYRSLAETLGHSISKEDAGQFLLDGLLITQNPEPSHSVHLAFEAPNPAVVKLFHENALRAGCSCIRAPMGTNPEQFATLVLDPDGNNIEVVFRASRKL